MFQLPILKSKSTNSQPPNDLSMKTTRDSNEQPNSENEFLPNNEEEDVWNQRDKMWDPPSDGDKQDPVNFFLFNSTQAENDYSNDEEPIKSIDIQAPQTTKTNKPIYEKDDVTYPISLDTHFLSETEDEPIALPPIPPKNKKPIAPPNIPPKNKEADPVKMNPTKSNSLLRKLNSERKTIMFQYKDKSKMNLKENKSPKT
jgi:hypothetical protein